MKSVVLVFLVLAGLGGGLWWLTDRHQTRVAAEAAAVQQAEADRLRTQRLELFGEAALAEGIKWTDTGLGLRMLREGAGARPLPGGFVTFSYVVRLKDGTEVDRSRQPLETQIGRMIPGVSSGLLQMRGGGSAVLYIPPRLGYGGSAYGSIPPDSGLIFEVELLER